ncbi:Possible exported protein [Vibrio casei]|uniref:TIGR02099 family protein n=2 Tax=Vibrio casei TaxID=673372 RepID=A0A368LPR1_9VIBR|nr:MULTISPECIES: YhdP family protein [Vibrio]RCS73890.1 TIGR02099 family protein [Vibrio casei]SJN31683.1 Possible exported protein [Vibrio casei]HBV77205.1 TIGR02099 family protein [Vibrio sp.]
MTLATRLWRSLLWMVLTVAVLLAVTVTALRLFLPNLNQYRSDIEAQLLETTGLHFKVQDIKGYWGNISPSLALKNLQILLPNENKPILTVSRVDGELDLLSSLIHLKPKLANVEIQGLNADVSRWPLLPDDSEPQAPEADTLDSIKNIQNVFLKQLGEFSLVDSSVQYLALNGEVRRLDIDRLRWQNDGHNHKAEGVVSIAGGNLNKISVIANFREKGDLRFIDGDFFVSGQNIRVTPWMTAYLKDSTTIHSGRVSLNSWFSLKQGKPTDALVELLPSHLIWGDEKQPHQLNILHGVVKLKPKDKGWFIQGQQFDIETNQIKWPQFRFSVNFQPDHQAINVSQLQVGNLTPLVGLSSKDDSAMDWIKKIEPTGTIQDIRIDLPKELKQFTYSAKLVDVGIKQWELLPEVHKLSADITGDLNTASIKATLKDDTLPYGDVFQAPLVINDGKVNLVWQSDDQGWRIWADKIQVKTPDLEAIGEFKLDFPKGKSPFLAIYAEADAKKAGETWRYLPTLALGRDLTNYLSTAIQGGSAKTAKILWYGSLDDFPYQNNKGVFQVKVGLQDGRFSFDTAWPPITDLQLNLLFHNDSMYLDSDSATLMDVKAQHVSGVIPSLSEGGHIEITAQAQAEGSAIRDYMMATPLVDSVGAALTAVKVSGPVGSKFTITVPFNGDDASVTGYAKLKNNPIEVQSPPIQLEKATGKITFDNDVVKGAGIKASLLKQPISLDFSGQNQSKGYGVSIDVVGDADLVKLRKEVPSSWLTPLSGHAPWNLGVDIQLNDVGFTYQIDGGSDLEYLTSNYPEPLGKALGIKVKARLQAAGNQQVLNARVTLPEVKYQADIDIRPSTPVLTATNLVVGRGDFKVSPIGGHFVSVNRHKFNADNWLDFILDETRLVKVEGVDNDPKVVKLVPHTDGIKVTAVDNKTTRSGIHFPAIPMPEVVDVNTQTLTLGELDWHKVKFNAVHKAHDWKMKVSSSEAVGSGSFRNNRDLDLNLNSVHIFVPQWEKSKDEKLIRNLPKEEPLISSFDRKFHENMPNLVLKVGDLWLQGYKVGKVDMQLKREKDKLVWKNLDFNTGSNHLKATGWWQLSGNKSHSDFNFSLTGKNNSDVMERFGINSGIQKASFDIEINSNWDGAPWSVKTETLNGNVKTKFKDGVITDVNGAARLLGLFSLDSIIRKMKLDFTGVFDNGMTFDSISGTGKISKGVFITNDLDMDGSAGDLSLRGKADLNTQLVDAEVTFIPDLTSSIPLVAAFAVTPQAAIAVFAITKVLSPVVDVFTKIQYEIKGPLDDPSVKEISRSKGEYKLN